MRYKERHTRPDVCENCPEWSIKACLDCEHIRQRYEIDDQDWAREQEIRCQLRKLLDVEREDQYYILRWKSIDQRPADDTNILILECDEEFGHFCMPGRYRSGLFWYCEGGSPVDVMEEDSIIGWDYYPYEEHPDAALEDLLFSFVKDFAKDVRKGKAQWPVPIEIQNLPEV